MRPIRVLVADDHTLLREGLVALLVKDNACEIVAEAADGIAAVRALASGRGYFGPHASKVLAQQVQQPKAQLDDPYRGLTPREREVFHLIVEGLTTKEIAKRLDISSKTAENHRARVLDKLDVRNTAELVRYAMRKGLLD